VHAGPIAIAAVFVAMGKRAENTLAYGGWLFVHSPPIVGPLTTALGVALLAFSADPDLRLTRRVIPLVL
jgi:hypothetical protein